jgi:hypothetical protein
MHDQSVFYLQEQVYSCHCEVRIVSFQIPFEMMDLLGLKIEEEGFIFFLFLRYEILPSKCKCKNKLLVNQWSDFLAVIMKPLWKGNERVFRHGHSFNMGVCGSIVGWGTMLQAGRSHVPLTMRSLDFSIGLILPAALWPWGWLSP